MFEKKDHIDFDNIIEIKQSNDENYTAYLTKMSSKDLVKYSQTIRLAEPDNDGIQRFLDDNRANNIAKYFENSNAIFPTPIILSLNTDFLNYNNLNKMSLDKMSLDIRSDLINELGTPFSIIDGQHRVEGMKRYYNKYSLNGKNIDIPIIIYFDADQITSANIFVTINSNQRPVDKSIIYQLFGIMYNNKNVYTVQSFANQVVMLLNESENSPFKDSIRLLGRKKYGNEFISQGTVAKKIVERITNENKIIDDNNAIENGKTPENMKRKVFRQFFIANRPDVLAKIIINYFNAFSKVFPNIWDNSETYIAKKAIGFSSLMILLEEFNKNENDLSFEKICLILDHMREKAEKKIINLFEKTGSSESIATKIGKELILIYEKTK
ncbi:DGQHR domain-containing protein [Staphylococcus xylosus]